MLIKKLNIVLLALMLMLVLGGAVAAGADTAGNGAAAPEVKNLSLEEALQLAEQNNVSIKSAKTELDKAEVKADQTEDSYEKLRDAQDAPGGYMLSVFDTGVGGAYVSKEAAAKGLVVAQKSYEVALEQIKLAIKRVYYNVLMARDMVEVKEAALQRAQKQLDVANASFKVGSVAKTDVLLAESSLARVQAELTGARNSYKLSVIELNRELGLEINTPLNLTTKVDTQDILGEVQLDKYIAESLETRIDIAGARNKVEVAQITYDKLLIYKGGRSHDSKLAKLDLENAKVLLEDTKVYATYDITQAYYNVEAAGESLASLEKAVEHAKENLRLTELRYEVGVGTSLDVLDSSLHLAETETAMVQALYDYNLAKMAFETAKLAPSQF